MLKECRKEEANWRDENTKAAAAGDRAGCALHAHAAWLTGAVTTAVALPLHEAE
jgi:hypothetical protein